MESEYFQGLWEKWDQAVFSVTIGREMVFRIKPQSALSALTKHEAILVIY